MRKRRRKGPFLTLVICSDCGQRARLFRRELLAAKRPRCLACGGPLNRPRDMRPGGDPVQAKPFKQEHPESTPSNENGLSLILTPNPQQEIQESNAMEGLSDEDRTAVRRAFGRSPFDQPWGPETLATIHPEACEKAAQAADKVGDHDVAQYLRESAAAIRKQLAEAHRQ